jgi:predicted acylesterase/phospholipase RssA
MSSERTEERLDAMLAALRARPAHLDEITRARVGARIEAALAKAPDAAEAKATRRWRRGGVAAGLGLAAAAAVLAVVAAARDGEPAAGGSAVVGEAASTAGANPAAGSSGVPAEPAAPAAPAAPVAGTAAVAAATAPITVASGESAQLTLGGAAVTVYGPGGLSPTSDGAVVDAAGIVVDRQRGETPWSVRYRGVEVVATRATFAIDGGARTRVTVMRGELVLHCPSGSRTLHAGASATCEPPAKPHVAPQPPPPPAFSLGRPPTLEPESHPAAAPPAPAPQLPPELHPRPPAPSAPQPRSGPEPTAADPYSAAESALRRRDLDAARDALLAIVDAAPDSLDAATALLDLARLAARRGDASAALGYLDRLQRHPHRAALAAARGRSGTMAAGGIPMGKYFILACDGGGIRGYITTSVLQKLVGDPAVGNFLPQVSLRAGTSTGSFLALALAGGAAVSDLQALYQQASAQKLFTRNPAITGATASKHASLLARIEAELSRAWHHLARYYEELVHAQYTHDGVSKAAQALLGATTKLADLAPVIVNTLVLDDTRTPPGAWTPTALSNLGDSAEASMYAWEAALCSGAAPIYFPPYRPDSAPLGYCADGGLFANNPSLSAIVAALAQGVPLADIYLLSLDTGTTFDSMPPAVIDEDWGGPLDMGPLAWLYPEAKTSGGGTTPKFPLLSALMDASAESIAASAQSLLGARYHRVTVPLSGPVALDDASDAAYATMDASLASFFGSDAYPAVTTWLRALVGAS